MKPIWHLALALAATSFLHAAEPDKSTATTASLKAILSDAHAINAEHWIYNDLDAAMAEARKTGKPIFVTFRCVPCKACASFDAEVAKGSELITNLAQERFVSLRQVEMKGVDLSLFQFDHDLNWAAMFINADGVVYGRYGTQSAAGPDAYNSIESLEQAMLRVLDLHAKYPANATALADKRAAQKPYKTALEMPGLEDREKLRGPTARNNCIHCHNIHDAEQTEWQKNGTFSWDKVWRYPLPDNVGLHIDPKDGTRVESVVADTPAARAGMSAGDIVTHVNGQPIISIADIQWVLHGLPHGDAKVDFTYERAGKSTAATLALSGDWKKSDIIWRGSTWSIKPRPGFWAPEASAEELKRLGVKGGLSAFRVQWINLGQSEGRAARDAGLREGDFIVEIAHRPFKMTPTEFHWHVKTNHKIGDQLPLTIVRDGKRQTIALPLVP